MSASKDGSPTARALLALLFLAFLLGAVVQRRAEHLRCAYEARRLLEDRGHLVNEVRWQRAWHGELTRPARLMGRAEGLGLRLVGPEKATVVAPVRVDDEMGQ